MIGIAGANRDPLVRAVLDIASERDDGDYIRRTLGDDAVRAGFERAVFFLDYTFLVTPGRDNGPLDWWGGFERYFAPEVRRLPLIFDSCAYREFRGTAPKWSSYKRYLEAIDLCKPDAVIAKDVIGSQEQSCANYERMLVDGYGDLTIPSWQVRQAYDDRLSPVENGLRAARDSYLRWYCEHAELVAIGGLVQGPCPRDGRAAYLGAIASSFPDNRFWALGQASGVVVNGLGMRGLLNRISVDGMWWIWTARTEQLAIVDNGLLSNINLARSGRRSFFRFIEVMAASLRALLAAYAGLWSFPGPAVIPSDMADQDQVLELQRRVQSLVGMAQLDLFGAPG